MICAWPKICDKTWTWHHSIKLLNMKLTGTWREHDKNWNLTWMLHELKLENHDNQNDCQLFHQEYLNKSIASAQNIPSEILGQSKCFLHEYLNRGIWTIKISSPTAPWKISQVHGRPKENRSKPKRIQAIVAMEAPRCKRD